MIVADFLFVLAKINLAMAAAILMVALLRRPVRAAFPAPFAYALWLVVPAAALACLLPPRISDRRVKGGAYRPAQQRDHQDGGSHRQIDFCQNKQKVSHDHPPT